MLGIDHFATDLLQGRFDEGVMTRSRAPDRRALPASQGNQDEVQLPGFGRLQASCSSALWRSQLVDNSPELLFTLRNVDHLELVSQLYEGNLDQTRRRQG